MEAEMFDFLTILKMIAFFAMLTVVVIILIISLGYWMGMKKNRLKEDVDEAQAKLNDNLKNFKKLIEKEMLYLNEFKGTPRFEKEKEKRKKSLERRIYFIENKILREIKNIIEKY